MIKRLSRSRILGKESPLKARVVQIGGFSAHVNRDEMLCFLKGSKSRTKKIAAVHGKEEQTLAFAKFMENDGFNVVVPDVIIYSFEC